MTASLEQKEENKQHEIENESETDRVEEVEVAIPKSMADALEFEDPYNALLRLAQASQKKAYELSLELSKELDGVVLEVPEILSVHNKESPDTAAMACAESILQSLTKIASGGSQASKELRQLEDEKSELEAHAQDVETAWRLRNQSDIAAQSVSAKKYDTAAHALAEYHSLQPKITDRARAYAGDYTLSQLESTHKALRGTLLEKYQQAVQESNLQSLGTLTPLLQMVQLESEAVALYLRYLKSIWKVDQDDKKDNKDAPFYAPMAKVYNQAVTMLRHHLPLVSHWLYRADGDSAVVQLVQVQVEQAVCPLLEQYQRHKKLSQSSRNAQRVAGRLEDHYGSGGMQGNDDDGDDMGQMDDGDADDCGFSSLVGSLADVDAAMEEVALCIQHAERYTRFLRHTVHEIQRARKLRHDQAQEELRRQIQQEKLDRSTKSERTSDDDDDLDKKLLPFKPVEILPHSTPLDEVVAEIGGHYSVIERALLLASMQRAFDVQEDDLNQYSPLTIPGRAETSSSGGTMYHSQALQTTVVETCWYAARRGSQRALATGHAGTASAVVNAVADVLRGVVLEVLSRRADDVGVRRLKPGEGLLAGGSGMGMLFQGAASTLLNRPGRPPAQSGAGGSSHIAVEEEQARRRKLQQGIAKACATLNDLEVAVHYTEQLQKIMTDAINQGFPPNTHETEQLQTCVQSLGSVTEVYKLSSTSSMESLISILKPRIRALVSDAVGNTSDAAVPSAGFSSVMAGTKKGTDRMTVRMKYNLNDEQYQLLQVSEGYISRLCSCLDEIIRPLQMHLAPRLSDILVLGILGTTAIRLEVSLKKCRFTSLGALSLDSDMRDLLSFTKERLDSPELTSNMSLYRACTPLARLVQIAKLLTVDDLDDVLDLIRASKRKANWDLSLEDAKAFLELRVEFDSTKVRELLKIPDDE